MSTPTHPHLQPYRPGMGAIHKLAMDAFRAHWTVHGGTAPQKLMLSPSQADDLLLCQQYGAVAFPGCTPPRRDRFNGRPVDVSESTTGEIVAHDGSVTLLADYMPPSEPSAVKA